MKKRMAITLLAVVFFLGAIAFVKYRQIQTAMAQGMSYQPPPEAVTSIVVQPEEWPTTISGIGSVQAVQGVTVSADLSGIVQEIHFESGSTVRQGDVLVVLNASQEEAQEAAAQAQCDLDRINFDRAQSLHQTGVISQAQYDQSSAELKQADARLNEIRATIGRKTIRAPFGGTLGIRQVNLGQYLRDGDPVVPLQSLDPIYVNFTVPQQQIDLLHLGDEVQVTAEQMPGLELKGRISAINTVVDPDTRNMQVQATLENPQRKLRPGMFVRAEATVGGSQAFLAVPASAINYAPYGDSVFIIEDLTGPNGAAYKGVRQQFVKLGTARGDQIAVLSGLQAGQEVVTSGAFKLRNGASIVVKNQVQPSNDPAPRPEDS